MKRSILLAILAVFLLVIVGNLQAEDSPTNSGNLLIIDRGPITLNSGKRQQTIDFEVPAEFLDGCTNIELFVGTRKLTEDKAYMCYYSINGHEIGGGGGSVEGTGWHIGGKSAGLGQIHPGTNQIVFRVEEYKGIQREVTTYDVQIGGVVLYFYKENEADVGLLDYINYGEPPVPEGGGLIKESCWVAGLAHLHSTYSDGSYSVEARAKQMNELGYDYMILTDHFVQIDKPVKAPGTYYKNATDLAKSKVGFANYVKSCRTVTSNGHFVAVAGAEFNSPWHDEKGNANFAHTLCLGDIQKTKDLGAVEGKEGKQAELIAAINGVGLSAAAHPFLITTTSLSKEPWKGVRYLYDTRSKKKYAELDGVGMNGTVTPAQDDANTAFFMKLMKEHHSAFPFSDCDSHGFGDKDDAKRLERLTGVCIEGLLTKNSLLKALKEGHVWASIEGVRITDCDPIPGFVNQLLDEAKFSFTLSGLPTKVNCQMYRDGEPLPESKQVISPGSPTYSWVDKNCPETETWYNFRVLPNYLVTAPIIIRIGDWD